MIRTVAAVIALHTEGITRFTLCIGPYAIKLPKNLRGCDANYGERVEWKRAASERSAIMCPLLWSAPFGLFNIVRRAVPLAWEEQQRLMQDHAFPDWDYTPGDGPPCPFEFKESDWGRLSDGRLVALDYPALEIVDPDGEGQKMRPSL
jgi:hypothetical protein